MYRCQSDASLLLRVAMNFVVPLCSTYRFSSLRGRARREDTLGHEVHVRAVAAGAENAVNLRQALAAGQVGGRPTGDVVLVEVACRCPGPCCRYGGPHRPSVENAARAVGFAATPWTTEFTQPAHVGHLQREFSVGVDEPGWDRSRFPGAHRVTEVFALGPLPRRPRRRRAGPSLPRVAPWPEQQSAFPGGSHCSTRYRFSRAKTLVRASA